MVKTCGYSLSDNQLATALQQAGSHFVFDLKLSSAGYSDAHSFYSGVVAVAKIAPTHEKSTFLRRVIVITYSRTNFRPFNSLMHNIIGFSKE